MTSPITSLTIAGSPVRLSDVDYNVTVSHGRSDVFQQSNPSNMQATIRGPVSVDVTDAVVIEAYGRSRFVGEVTDVRVEFLGPLSPVAVTTFTAIGVLHKLGSALVAVAFPLQTVRERVEAVLDSTGYTFLNGATDELDLYAVTEDVPVPAMDLLDGLATTSGATFFDTPSGVIVFESYGVRGQTANPGIWAVQTGTWASQTAQWDDFPSTLGQVELPADAVIFAPTWSKNVTGIINRVAITYKDDAIYAAQDADSVAQYGNRSTELTTGLEAEADAIARANAILLAQARPLWNLGQVSVIVDELDEPTRDLVLAVQSGTTVLVTDMPYQGPVVGFLGICEGWTETYVPGQHVLTFSLSDRRYSYQTVTWGEVPPALAWEDVNPMLEWFNAVTPEILETV